MVAYSRGLGEPRLSPDGSLLAFVATVQGRGQLVVMPAAGGPEVAVTTEPGPPPAQAYGGGIFDWLPGGTGLVFAATDGSLYTVAATGGMARPFASPVGPGARLAAPAACGRFVTCVQSGPAEDLVLRFDFAREPHPGDIAWPALVARADFCFDPAIAADGRVAWHEWSVPDMAFDGGLIRERGSQPGAPVVDVAGRPGLVSVGQPRYAPEGRWLAFTSDESGWANISVRPAEPLGPPGSARPIAAEAYEQADPAWGLGQRSFAWSPDGRLIAYQRNESGFGRLGIVDIATGVRTELSKGIHGGLSWQGDRIACIRSGARTPTHVAVFDLETSGGRLTSARRVAARGPVGGWEEAGLVEPEVVHWPADDGAEIHGRLYRPEDVERPPMLCWVHGGPTSQWPVTFRERFAYFVAKGWAVLVPDHRGSTGWGRAYQRAMRERWGDLDVHDTAAGIRHAMDQGWCDPRRVVVIGGSAGGFTVLGVLARYPDLCAAGVDLFGVADLLQLDEVTHRFEAHYNASLIGRLPEAIDRYRDSSPVNFADRIIAPLLILQGSADPVVPLSQSQAIADRLRSLGRTVEMHVYDGEGHGWGRPDVVMDEITRTEDFLRRHVLRWRS